MRSPSVLGLTHLLQSLCVAFAQSMAERNTLVEHETVAAPAALRFRDALQIFQDAALEVIDLGKATIQQIGAGLFAADTAGAEHRDLSVPRRVEFARDEILELAETADVRDRSRPRRCPSPLRRRCGCRSPAYPADRSARSSRSGRRKSPTCRVGSTAGSPSVTISFFSRTFSRWNGIADAVENFSRGRSSRPPNRRPSRNSSIKASIAPDAPARVPLMPSCASSTLPFNWRPAQVARSGSRSSRKSGRAAN